MQPRRDLRVDQNMSRSLLAGTWQWGGDAYPITFDQRFAELVAIPGCQSMSVRCLLKRVHSYDRRRVLSALRRALRMSGEISVDCRIRSARGPTWIQVIGTASVADSGAVSASGIALDISACKRDNAVRSQAEESLDRIADLTLAAHQLARSSRLTYLGILIERVLGVVGQRLAQMQKKLAKTSGGGLQRNAVRRKAADGGGRPVRTLTDGKTHSRADRSR